MRRKKVRKQLLKPGQMGSRIAFNDYEEYIEALNEALAAAKTTLDNNAKGQLISPILCTPWLKEVEKAQALIIKAAVGK